MRRIIMRLLMAKLVPVAISFVTKAFRKKKQAANIEALDEAQNLDAVNEISE